MARVYLADKDTLDTVNTKVGTANDAASATPISLFAGIKQLISVLSVHIASWTSARAGKIDNLDASISSRAAASTALSKNTWTDARAAKIDNIDINAAKLNNMLDKPKTQIYERTCVSGSSNMVEIANLVITRPSYVLVKAEGKSEQYDCVVRLNNEEVFVFFNGPTDYSVILNGNVSIYGCSRDRYYEKTFKVFVTEL